MYYVKYWLVMDFWDHTEAAYIFTGIEPRSIKYDDKVNITSYQSFVRDRFCNTDKYHALEINYKTGLNQAAAIARLIQEVENIKRPPKFWLSRAIEKEINIDYITKIVNYLKLFDNTDNNLVANLTDVKKVSSMSDREKNTLLVIIAALAKEAKVDISKVSKSSELIANLTHLLGAPIGATTIETHLKKNSRSPAKTHQIKNLSPVGYLVLPIGIMKI